MDQKIPEPLSRPVEPAKPTANVAPEQAHVAMATSTPLGTPAANVGRSGRGRPVLAIILILTLMASTAAFGYLWWQARSAQAQLSQLKSDKEAAEKKASEAETKLRELEKEEEGSGASLQNDVHRKEDPDTVSSGLEQYYNDQRVYPAGLVSSLTAIISRQYDLIR